MNLIRNVEGKVVTHALNRTCSPLPWSPREVFCEVNYMEVRPTLFQLRIEALLDFKLLFLHR